MAKKDQEIPRSRTRSLFSMATKVVLKEGQALFHNKAEKQLSKMMSQADIIVNHVGQLKGAAMKAVQMITIEAQDILPPEVIQILERLQSQAPPLSNDLMMSCLREELGEELFLDLKEISMNPIASASIGQVYEASLNGESVVIKVQYPGIAGSVDADLKVLKKLIRSLLFVLGKQVSVDDLFEELNRVLQLETNYINEAGNLLKYRQFFKGSCDYRVPKVFREYTTEKVLVLSNENGEEFSIWLRNDPNRESKEIVGKQLLNLYIKEFFENHFVQTDPNPANFLINESHQLVLLDFGATVSYSKKFVKSYQDLLRVVFSGKESDILSMMEELKFISSKESEETKEKFISFVKLSLLPFSVNQQPFDFSKMDYTDEIRRQALSFSKSIKYSAPPKQVIFLHRKLGGIFLLLKRLGVKIDLTSYRERILAMNIE